MLLLELKTDICKFEMIIFLRCNIQLVKHELERNRYRVIYH